MTSRLVIADPGIDDLVAFALLAKLDGAAANHIKSTFGNVAQSLTSRNAREFISLSEVPWSHEDGAHLPVGGTVERPWPTYFHGDDGVWNVHHLSEVSKIPAVNDEQFHESVISLAPMTELLHSIESGVQQVTAMGGALDVEGNETKYAETNIAFDPDAAHIFFQRCEGIDVRVIPLDVTRKLTWSRDAVESVACATPVQQWIKEILLTWYDKYDHSREEEFCLHDPLAVYLDFHPDNATWISEGLDVLTQGEERGRLVRSNVSPHCRIATGINNPQELSNELLALVFGDQ